MVEIRALKEEDRGHVRALELFCVREYLESALKRNWDELSPGTHRPARRVCQGFLRFLQGCGPELRGHRGQADRRLHLRPDGGARLQRRQGGLDRESYGPPHAPAEGHRLHAAEEGLRRGQEEGGQGGPERHPAGQPSAILLHKKVGFFIDGRKLAFLDLESFE